MVFGTEVFKYWVLGPSGFFGPRWRFHTRFAGQFLTPASTLLKMLAAEKQIWLFQYATRLKEAAAVACKGFKKCISLFGIVLVQTDLGRRNLQAC